MALLAAVACTKGLKPDMTAKDLTGEYQAGNYTAKVDNFMILFDASSSMLEGDGDYVKFDLAKAFVYRMNQTLPPLKMQGAMRTFGHEPSVSAKKTMLFYGVSEYQRAHLNKGLDALTVPGGLTPMVDGLKAAAGDIKPLPGKTALIILSDGQDVGDAPLKSIEGLKKDMGDRLCVYTVHFGYNAEGAALLQKMASAGGCGFAIAAREVATADQMVAFVNKVFLDKDMDSDGDGVMDRKDKCPNTPKGTKVDADGCPIKVAAPVDIDSDGDGVLDKNDKCPNTPKGAKVNAVGCWVLKNVFFDTAKADIKPDMTAGLDEALTVLQKNPGMRIEVQGHTDSDGADAYNLDLSNRRAQAVVGYFAQKGIEANRLSAKGYGESKPVADNKTREGKAQNRRVELQPIE
jgi:OOP family OmpA-OmpF porin